jgi:hypothetical protein
MSSKFEVKLGGPLGQGPAAFKESLEKKLTAAALARARHHGHPKHPPHRRPEHQPVPSEKITSLVTSMGLAQANPTFAAVA